ncbi:sigma-54 interaction domain-containing protein [Natronincola ferrireducens]|uniref:HTH-type transcriptional regulatory protein TyrR n=1 Tax=Natronincola ferrireducens TaxID=393762 RepID=A0A1G9D8W5_9FIRM|nr:sigma 54-interacting transcriptional regulator [Natronincola ferrireducens]SDK60368.1 PAS domain S-box-containing protein [Natronincola ferrireducens]
MGNVFILEKNKNNPIYGGFLYHCDEIHGIIPSNHFEDFDSILDSIQDAITIDDKHGNTLWANKACEQLYEIQREELIGKNVEVLEKMGIFSHSVVKEVLKKKEQISILHSNKKGKKILITGNPILDQEGNIYKIISTSRDITELIVLKNELEDIQNQLEELREKQQIVINNFIIESQIMKDILQLAKRLAQVDSTVLITGESGVGKGEIAKFIHESGSRKDHSLIKVNCGAIPELLLESELFGYEYGAFTGSKKQGKKGLFELAHRGTIFLDEIGELPLSLQVKILQVIQDKEIQRVGGLTSIPIDARIIAATNKDLQSMVNEKKFREDLFYRLNVVPIHIPSLRERPEDIFPLIRHFLRKYNKKFNMSKRLDSSTVAILMKYTWPGNVRELENIIERVIITTQQDNISPQNLPNYIINESENSSDIKISSATKNLKDTIEEIEKQIIHKAVTKYKTTREVAKVLGVSQPTIVRKMNKYKIAEVILQDYDTSSS